MGLISTYRCWPTVIVRGRSRQRGESACHEMSIGWKNSEVIDPLAAGGGTRLR